MDRRLCISFMGDCKPEHIKQIQEYLHEIEPKYILTVVDNPYRTTLTLMAYPLYSVVMVTNQKEPIRGWYKVHVATLELQKEDIQHQYRELMRKKRNANWNKWD